MKIDKLKTKITLVFNEDLLDKPRIVVMTEQGGKWFVLNENIPFETFRGGNYKRDIIAQVDTMKEALDIHKKVVKGEPING